MKNILLSFIIIIIVSTVVVIILSFGVRTKVSAVSPGIDNTQTQIVFMEEVVSNYPTYFDAHLELSRLYLLEGNLIKAKYSLSRAKEIDPNSKYVKNYEEVLERFN